MRRIGSIVLLTFSLAAVLSCSSGLKAPEAARPTVSDYRLTLDFGKGAASTGNIIYVAWIESSDRSFVRYIYTCERLLNGSEKPNIPQKATCPYWRTGLYDTAYDDDIDAVSGPTKRDQDFTAGISIPSGSPSRFTVYFEYDRSFDGNDWWTDQPAILYAADVDLSDGPNSRTFALGARGWSRNAGGGSGGNMNKASDDFPNATGIGELVSEMRYIRNHAELGEDLFGDAYAAGSAEDATNMVGSLTLAATKE